MLAEAGRNLQKTIQEDDKRYMRRTKRGPYDKDGNRIPSFTLISSAVEEICPNCGNNILRYKMIKSKSENIEEYICDKCDYVRNAQGEYKDQRELTETLKGILKQIDAMDEKIARLKIEIKNDI